MARRQGQRRKPKSSMHYTSKTRGNYPAAGWCQRFAATPEFPEGCPGRPAECEGCFRESVWKKSLNKEAAKHEEE